MLFNLPDLIDIYLDNRSYLDTDSTEDQIPQKKGRLAAHLCFEDFMNEIYLHSILDIANEVV